MTRQREPLPTRVEGLAPLPDSFDRTLDRGLVALGLELPAATREELKAHVRLLLAWTEAINLTAIRDPDAVAREHVLDSLSAVPLLLQLGVRRFVDLGSGGGFPGLPITLALPVEKALLVDSVAKKARFLGTVVQALDLGDRLGVAAERAELLARDRAHRERWAAVVVRAVADLPELVELAFPLLEVGGSMIAWKRGDVAAEVERGGRAIAALGGGAVAVHPNPVPGLEDHVLVAATKRAPTPANFPRDPAERKRRPW